MKTLDEVIKAKELCELICCDEEKCQDCPYAKQDENSDWSFFCHDCETDALHYLKAFRDMEDELNDIRREHIEQMKNPPLTWDELRTMEGKPIWVEESAENGLWWTYWVIWEQENAVLPGKNYGTTWQAYRKERK